MLISQDYKLFSSVISSKRVQFDNARVNGQSEIPFESKLTDI